MRRIETTRGTVEIRELSSIAEMVAAEDLQRAVWGWEAVPHPKEILIPIQHEGGLLAGAFSIAGEMVGLIFSFPTRDPATMHSQLLATIEPWRGCGIGESLKWYQRDWCLERGIRLARWTVDPLRAANAALNIRRLGGTASTYYTDYYGPMQGIDAGAPTDRLLVEWRLDSPRVAHLAARAPADSGFPGIAAANEIEDGAPVQVRTDLTASRMLVRLPDDFIQLSKDNPGLALAWRKQTRALFQHYFSRDYQITGFTRAGGPAYLLEKSLSDGS